MELGNNGMNEVLVNSEILEKYIRENYPKYNLIVILSLLQKSYRQIYLN